MLTTIGVRWWANLPIDQMPISASGMLGWRFALVIATARSFPALMCGAAEIVVVKSIVTRPPRTSVTAGGMPL